MGRPKKIDNTAGDKDSPAATPEQIDIEVTQETLDLNPELVDEGVEVGETIQVDPEDIQSDEDPEEDIDQEDQDDEEYQEPKQYVVKTPFRDAEIKDRYVVYQEDEDIHFDGERLQYLIDNGFVKEKE